MQDGIDPKRLTRSRRTPLLAAILVSAVLVAGCGRSSPSPTAATVGGASTSASSTASAGPATTAGSSTAAGGGAASAASSGSIGGPAGALSFAECMRSNGVPSFPDPKPGGGYDFQVGVSSPVFKAAQAKCQKLLPNGGAPPTFSEQALVQLQRIATCMRQHGISDFPDPKRAPQGGLSGVGVGSGDRGITDYRGVLLAFPFTINMQSPAYKQAASACGASFLV